MGVRGGGVVHAVLKYGSTGSIKNAVPNHKDKNTCRNVAVLGRAEINSWANSENPTGLKMVYDKLTDNRRDTEIKALEGHTINTWKRIFDETVKAASPSVLDEVLPANGLTPAVDGGRILHQRYNNSTRKRPAGKDTLLRLG